MLLEPRSVERGLFKPAAVERLFQEHRVRYCDHYDRIWRLLNLEVWHASVWKEIRRDSGLDASGDKAEHLRVTARA